MARMDKPGRRARREGTVAVERRPLAERKAIAADIQKVKRDLERRDIEKLPNGV